MSKSRALRPAIAVSLVLASAAPLLADRPPPHREVPDDPPSHRPYPPPAPPGAPEGGGPPAVGPYRSVQVNVNALGQNIPGDAANEPTVAVSPLNPNIINVGWRQFDDVASNFRQAGHAYSQDGGHTWTFPGSLMPGVFNSDPVMAADAAGTFYFLTIDNPEMRLFKSFDGGVNWSPPIQVLPGFHDKQWMAIDRTGGIGNGHIYIAYTGTTQFTRSTDGGTTYLTPIACPISDTFWGTLDIASNGDLYLVDRTFQVVRSTDAENAAVTPTFQTLATVNIGGTVVFGGAPNPGGLVGQPWIVIDRSSGPFSGNVYVLSSVDPPGADPLDVMFARSTDGGVTWSPPIRVNDDPTGNVAWQWFGTLSIAPTGRLDATWNDTRNSGQAIISEVFYAYSVDGGVTWSPNIRVSPSFNSVIGWPNQNKIGDYCGMYSDAAATHLAYAATFNGEQDVYFLTIPFDCNGNGVFDGQDIAAGTSDDCNANETPDECDTLGDLDGDGSLSELDIPAFAAALIAADPDCLILADVNLDASLDGRDVKTFVDLLIGA